MVDVKCAPPIRPYAILRKWIGEGCREDPADFARCVGIEVYPPSGRLLKRPAHTQQLNVIAHFNDGTTRDITELAVYTSSDTEVATVTAGGLPVGHDRGEAALVVRYMEFIETTFITFVKDIDGYEWNSPSTNNYIDELVDAKLKQLKFLPSELCTDEEFIRRAYLDVIGILPTVDVVGEFLADDSPDRRSRLIDKLLERPEYAKFWSLKWGDLLRLTNAQVGGDGVYKYHRWVERSLDSNMPYDEFARQLLASSGSSLTNPPVNFYRTAADEFDCVGNDFAGVSRLAVAMCQMPQSPIRTLDARQLLRHGRLL